MSRGRRGWLARLTPLAAPVRYRALEATGGFLLGASLGGRERLSVE